MATTKIIPGFVLLTVLTLLPLVSSFAYELEIINLEHRTAEDVIPIIKPLLEKKESISGEKSVLFLRASNETIQQVISILPIIDAELRVLRISIMQETAQMMERYGYNISSNKANKNNSTSMIYSTQRSGNNPKQQVINVSEGQWASLQTGINIPSLMRTTNSDGTVTESVNYQSIFSKLKIHPSIKGKEFKIQIQSNTGTNSNISNSQTLTSYVHGKLGEWIALGGIKDNKNNHSNRYTFTTDRNNHSQQQIFVKIELSQHND